MHKYPRSSVNSIQMHAVLKYIYIIILYYNYHDINYILYNYILYNYILYNYILYNYILYNYIII